MSYHRVINEKKLSECQTSKMGRKERQRSSQNLENIRGDQIVIDRIKIQRLSKEEIQDLKPSHRVIKHLSLLNWLMKLLWKMMTSCIYECKVEIQN